MSKHNITEEDNYYRCEDCGTICNSKGVFDIYDCSSILD